MVFQSFFLGLVQGITEFLPVSSSAHLALIQHYLGWAQPALTFDILLHLATMVATLFYFREDLILFGGQWFYGLVQRDARSQPGWNLGWAMIAGTVATVVIGLPLKPLVERFSTSVPVIGFFLLVTSLLLWIATKWKGGEDKISVSRGIKVGLAQGLAVMPGISRSGSTIVAGLGLGLSREDAFRFSFFLSLPAILGASLLELKDVLCEKALFLPGGWYLGVITAAVSGYIALALLHKVVTLGKWRYFSWYCALLGIACLI